MVRLRGFFGVLGAAVCVAGLFTACPAASSNNRVGKVGVDIDPNDRAAWTLASSKFNSAEAVSGIYYAAGTIGTLYIFGGSGEYSSSTDGGETWSYPITIGAFTKNGMIRGMSVISSKMVAVGTTGIVGVIATSAATPLTWTAVTNGLEPFAGEQFTGIASDGHSFVAVGTGSNYAKSNDGTIWGSAVYENDANASMSHIICTAANNFVLTFAGGGFGSIALSNPNDTQSELTQAADVLVSSVNSIAYDGTKYVAVGDDGLVAWATDITSWTRVESPCFEDKNNIRDIAYGNDKFVAVAKGRIAYSFDGVEWTQEAEPTFIVLEELCAIAFDPARKQFIVVSEHGRIAYSKANY
jgi:photosystem II stability/assembly factor-like uncharacterized protein